MPLNDRLKSFLDERGASYEIQSHAEAFTAQEIAAAVHVPGRDVAKVVIVRDAAGEHLMAVVCAPARVNLETLAKAAGRGELILAPEPEVERLFPDCQKGAMPPFGNLYDLPVFLDSHFPPKEDIFFQAGNHREVVRMRYADFERLVQPTVGDYCVH